MQTDAAFFANNSQHCWMLHVASVCTSCCMLLDVVAQSLKPVKLFSQQLPTFLLFRDRRSVAQQCWIRLHSSSNIVGATHAHYAWFTKTYGLYPSHDALQVPTLLGVFCTKRTQQLPRLLAQRCWELLRPFTRSCTTGLRREIGQPISRLFYGERNLTTRICYFSFWELVFELQVSSPAFYKVIELKNRDGVLKNANEVTSS